LENRKRRKARPLPRHGFEQRAVWSKCEMKIVGIEEDENILKQIPSIQ